MSVELLFNLPHIIYVMWYVGPTSVLIFIT